jgi:hypothetical protein
MMTPPGCAVGLGLGEGRGPTGVDPPQPAVKATSAMTAARDAAEPGGGAVFTLEMGRRKREGGRACPEKTA